MEKGPKKQKCIQYNLKYNYISKSGRGIVEDLYKKQAETNKTNWIKQIIK